MAIDYDELTDFDFQILNAVYEKQPISKKDLMLLFPYQKALDPRIETLATSERKEIINGFSIPIKNTAYLRFETIETRGSCGENNVECTDKLLITELGIKTVEDWKLSKIQDSKQLWESRAWKLAPILISLVALIVAIVSLLEALHWIHLAQ